MVHSDNYAQERAEAVVVTALRAMVGLIFVVHGGMKLMDIPGTIQGFAQLGIPYPQYAVYLAIAGEFLGGLGILFGLLTRVAALGALSTMAVAIGYVHMGHGLLAKNGGWEYPLVLGLVALYFVTHGAGPASVDALIRRRRYPQESQPRTERIRSYA
jgi:putative oxidoreductase